MLLLEHLGFMVNQDKSQLTASQKVVYLGFVIDSIAMKFYLPEVKLDKVRSACRNSMSQRTPSVREVASLVGVLSATRPAVLPAPLYCCQLQNLLVWSLRRLSLFDDLVTLEMQRKA